jgi:hypothetical protein
MRKKCKIIMLPTNNEEHSLILKHTGVLFVQTESKSFSGEKYDLYILSDDKITKDNYYLTDAGIFRCSGDETDRELSKFDKIIATTDTNLLEHCRGVHRIGEGCNLGFNCIYPNCRPGKIEDNFVIDYVEFFNDGKPLKEVYVTYDLTPNDSGLRDGGIGKLTPTLRSDKTVIISPYSEKTYSRDDLKKLWDNHPGVEYMVGTTLSDTLFDKWVKENLE